MSIDPAIQKRSLGEAQFLRAKYYFDLVRAYGDVPLLTTPPASLAEVNVPRIARRRRVRPDCKGPDRCHRQLCRPPIAATTWAGPPSGPPRACWPRCTSPRATWPGPPSGPRPLIAGSGKSLWANYGDNFKVANENGKESLFEVQYISGRNEYTFDGLGFVGNEFFGPRGQGIVPQGGYGFNIPEPDFVNGYEAGDKRRQVTIWEPGDKYPDGRAAAGFAARLAERLQLQKVVYGQGEHQHLGFGAQHSGVAPGRDVPDSGRGRRSYGLRAGSHQQSAPPGLRPAHRHAQHPRPDRRHQYGRLQAGRVAGAEVRAGLRERPVV